MWTEFLVAPMILFCGVAVLIAAASFRLGRIQEELQALPSRPSPELLPTARQLLARCTLLRRVLLSLFAAVFFFGASILAGLLKQAWEQAPAWLAEALATTGSLFLATAAVHLVREGLKNLVTIDVQLRKLIGETPQPNSQNQGPMRVIFEFAGGPLDGKTVEGKLGDQGEAERFFLITHRGTIGQRFKLASDYAVDILSQAAAGKDAARLFQKHVYVVTDRLDGENEVLVRAEYSPRG